MAMTNAQRQARFRAKRHALSRQKELFCSVENVEEICSGKMIQKLKK